MKFISNVFCAALVFTGVAIAPVQAQQSVGFDIPSPEAIEQMKERRKSHALGERLGRSVMEAFELYEESKIEEAIVVLEKQKPHTDYERAYLSRFIGTMYASLEDEKAQPLKAIELLKKAVEYDVLSYSDQKHSIQLVGNLQLQQELFADAIQSFKQYLQFAGEWEAEILFRMAAAHMELKNFDDVIPFARKAIENYDTPNRNPYVLMIGAYFEKGDVKSAITVLEEGLNYLPDQIRWWSQLGAFYAMEEQYEKSLSTLAIAYDAGYFDRSSDYRYLVQMYSNNSIPYHAGTLMEKHIKAGDIEETRSNWASAARSYYAAREFKRAASVYDQVVKNSDTKGDRASGYKSQGDAYVLAEEYTRAAQSYQKAIEQGDAKGDALGRLYLSLGEAQFNARQYKQSVNSLERALQYSATKRNAESWISFVKDTASRRGVQL